ncbi:MAG TPA: DUF4097 family beta strand repeat-containing protein [Longimicrobiales bacterium]|nr:DUF4097 family beta strand repeat-containing protein [Longimicrobiales bacterium]
MITALLAGALAMTIPQQQMDTTFAVRPGGELNVDVMNGTITINTWDRDAMRVHASGSARDVDIDHDGAEVDIDVESRGIPRSVTLEITVPRSYSVAVDGLNIAVIVENLRGSAAIENVEGAIVVRGVTGDVKVESVSGSVTIENVRGALSVATVNQAIRITGSRGTIEAETVNGSIVMRRVDSADVEASTINGLVEYLGTVHDGGSYFLGTHNGRITMGIPAQANASVAVDTQNGRVQSEFAVRVGGNGQRDFSFTVGSGSARVELESYNGTINLVRPTGR